MIHRSSWAGGYGHYGLALSLVLVMVVSCAGHQRIEMAPDRGALSSVRTIFLGDFGTTEGSDIVREKIRILLLNSGRFALVDSADMADAILTGAAGIDRGTHEGTTVYAGIGLLRLVETRSQRIIWSHEYKRGFMFGGSVSTRIAKQMVDQLLKDAGSF